VCNYVRKDIEQVLMKLGGQLIWMSLVECLEYIGCICEVFRWFTTCCVGGIVKSFPLDQWICDRARDRLSQNMWDDTLLIIGKGPRKQWLSFLEG